MDGRPGIELVGVSSGYDGVRVLRGVSFAAPAGRITVMIGPSGAGKTTCVSHMVALRPPSRGAVLIEGDSLWDMSKRELARLRRRCGVLLQGAGVYGSALWESMTVLENVEHQLRTLTTLTDEEIRERALERLGEVGLAAAAHEAPAHLSAGMRKRVAIARALASDPDYAILDGFELGIDKVRLAGLCTLVRARHERVGSTMLVVTQDMEVARRLADHVVVLIGGRVEDEGPPEEVLAQHKGPDPFRCTPRLADDPPAAGRPAPKPANLLDVPLWIAGVALLAAMTGTVIALGGRGPLEAAIIIAAWLVAGAVFAARGRD